jgi:hypothetical protein
MSLQQVRLVIFALKVLGEFGKILYLHIVRDSSRLVAPRPAIAIIVRVGIVAFVLCLSVVNSAYQQFTSKLQLIPIITIP